MCLSLNDNKVCGFKFDKSINALFYWELDLNGSMEQRKGKNVFRLGFDEEIDLDRLFDFVSFLRG